MLPYLASPVTLAHAGHEEMEEPAAFPVVESKISTVLLVPALPAAAAPMWLEEAETEAGV